VTINELLERLNAQVHLSAAGKVTARMLEDWAYEGLIPGPNRFTGTPKPNWQWSEESLDAAIDIIGHRKRGFKRVTAIRAQRWLEGKATQPRPDREALVKEFIRARNLLVRFVSSSHGMRRDTTLSEYKRRALLRQLGPLAPVFERAGVNPGGAVFLVFYEFARFGEQITPIEEDKEPLAALLSKVALPNGVHIFAGLLEDDETHPLSAVHSIRNLSRKQLEECRALVSTFPLALAFGQSVVTLFATDAEKQTLTGAAWSAASGSFDRWPWMIFTFVFVANIMYHWKAEDLLSRNWEFHA
jgi:hypothetical protein